MDWGLCQLTKTDSYEAALYTANPDYCCQLTWVREGAATPGGMEVGPVPPLVGKRVGVGCGGGGITVGGDKVTGGEVAVSPSVKHIK